MQSLRLLSYSYLRNYNGRLCMIETASAVSSKKIRRSLDAQCERLLSTSSSSSSKRRIDPLAKRPNQKCDPYGQGGKPMTLEQAQSLQGTLHDDWQLEFAKDNTATDTTSESWLSSPTTLEQPVALVRDVGHSDFTQGARLVAHMAAVAQLQNHYPRITLDRRIVRKEWQVFTRLRCHTTVLGGLSTHDFHLAMMMDVELERPNVKELWKPMKNESNV